jgi:uncharacterized protein (DUF849 family)
MIQGEAEMGVSAGDKLIVTVAVTGSVTPTNKTSRIPITPQEIADSAIACYREGASIAHIFEDNLYLAKGVLEQTNAQFVKKVAEIARLLGRELARPDEAREILMMK